MKIFGGTLNCFVGIKIRELAAPRLGITDLTVSTEKLRITLQKYKKCGMFMKLRPELRPYIFESKIIS